MYNPEARFDQVVNLQVVNQLKYGQEPDSHFHPDKHFA